MKMHSKSIVNIKDSKQWELDYEIASLEKKITKTFEMLIEQFQVTQKHVKQTSNKLAKAIRKLNERLNKKYYLLVEKSMWQMTTQRLLALDLRKNIGFIFISYFCKKMSDYSVHITNHFSRYEVASDKVADFQKGMALLIEMMFVIKTILLEGNLDLLKEAITAAVKIRKLLNKNEKTLAKQMEEKNFTLKPIIILNLFRQWKYLSRSADHLLEIGEWIYYYYKAVMPDIVKSIIS